MKKNLSDENSYKQVQIKLGRFAARAESEDPNQAIVKADAFDELNKKV